MTAMKVRCWLADMLSEGCLRALNWLVPAAIEETAQGEDEAAVDQPPSPASASEPAPPSEPLTLFVDADDLGYRLEAWVGYAAGMRRDLMPWEAAAIADHAMANLSASMWGIVPLFHPIKPGREDGMAVEQRVRVAHSVLRLMAERDRDGIAIRVRIESPEETAANDAMGVTLPTPVHERGR